MVFLNFTLCSRYILYLSRTGSYRYYGTEQPTLVLDKLVELYRRPSSPLVCLRFCRMSSVGPTTDSCWSLVSADQAVTRKTCRPLPYFVDSLTSFIIIASSLRYVCAYLFIFIIIYRLRFRSPRSTS